MRAIEAEMRMLKIRELELLNSMTNHANYVGVLYGTIDVKEWQRRSDKNEEDFMKKIREIRS